MKLKINGIESEVDESITIFSLLENLNIEPARVAVEVNLKIIKRCNFNDHYLKEGDAVEIVNFVGGG
ncbi:MAG: sulfur carrier protein ThiS [Thermodesulfovibrionia bacterium]|nr:sulfur carrier protein ThiS [Thermodesulfovibrionia bacterium]